MKKVNYFMALILLALSGYFIYEAQSFITVDPNDVGPGFYPILISGIMIVLALILVFQNLFCSTANEQDTTSQQVHFFTKAQVRPYLTMGLLIVYIVSMSKLGFILSTIFFLLILTCMFFGKELNRYNFITAIAVAVACSFGIYLLFHSLLKVPLPMWALF